VLTFIVHWTDKVLCNVRISFLSFQAFEVVQFRSGTQCWVTGCLLCSVSGSYNGLNFWGQMSSGGKKLSDFLLDVLKLRPVRSVGMLGNKQPVVYCDILEE